MFPVNRTCVVLIADPAKDVSAKWFRLNDLPVVPSEAARTALSHISYRHFVLLENLCFISQNTEMATHEKQRLPIDETTLTGFVAI